MASIRGGSKLKMSDETFDFVCTACARDKRTIEAVKYCIECGGYCFQSCVDTHRKFPTLNGHKIVDVSKSNKATEGQSTVTEFPIERCSIHQSKIVDMYCEDHDAVGCSVCFAKDHRVCNENGIQSVTDMINTIFNVSVCKRARKRLNMTMVQVKAISQSKDATLQALVNAKEKALETVEIFKKTLVAVVRKVTACTRQEVEAAYKELEKVITNQKQKAEKIERDLQALDDKLKRSEGNRAQQFVCSKIAQDKIKEVDAEKSNLNIDQDTHVGLSFCPNQSLMQYLSALQGIGQVQKQGFQNIREEEESAFGYEYTPPDVCEQLGMASEQQRRRRPAQRMAYGSYGDVFDDGSGYQDDD